MLKKCLDIIPHAFGNVIALLILDFSLDYEVTLIYFLHPKSYTIMGNDNDFANQLVYVS